MAVTYRGITNKTGSDVSGNAVTFGLPSGTIAGDLLVLHQHLSGNPASFTVTQPSGFTLADATNRGTGTNAPNGVLSYKVADASDISTGSVQTSFSGSYDYKFGSLVSVTGQKLVSSVTVGSGTATASSGPTIANSITPNTENTPSFYLSFWASANPSTTYTTTGIAIATSNPSWTNIANQTVNTVGPVYHNQAISYASRPEVTATGNSSATSSNSANADWVGQIMSISPIANVSLSDTVTATESLTVSTMITILLTETIALTDSFVGIFQRLWTNVSKNISNTWTNQNKS